MNYIYGLIHCAVAALLLVAICVIPDMYGWAFDDWACSATDKCPTYLYKHGYTHHWGNRHWIFATILSLWMLIHFAIGTRFIWREEFILTVRDTDLRRNYEDFAPQRFIVPTPTNYGEISEQVTPPPPPRQEARIIKEGKQPTKS